MVCPLSPITVTYPHHRSMVMTTDALTHRWRCDRGFGIVHALKRSVRHREVFDIKCWPGVIFSHRYQTTFRSANNSSSQLKQTTTSLFPIRPLITIFTTLPPLRLPPSNHPTHSNNISPHPPNDSPPCPVRAPPPLYPPLTCTCARAYPRRAHTNHLRPDRLLPHLQPQHGSDDIPWAEDVCDGSTTPSEEGKTKWGSK